MPKLATKEYVRVGLSASMQAYLGEKAEHSGLSIADLFRVYVSNDPEFKKFIASKSSQKPEEPDLTPVGPRPRALSDYPTPE